MADAAELESMVVRLIGDSSEYTKMLKDAAETTQKSADDIKGASERIEGFSGSLKGFASSAIGALSGIGISLGAMSAFFKFDEMERGALRLRAAIQANGGDVATATTEYMRFARSIEDVTLTSKGMVLGMLQQAESMGVSGQTAERAARNAVALAAANGGTADSYLRQTVALEHGNAEMLSRILPLRHITDETQRAAEAQRLLGNMFEVATAEANTAGGRLERLQRGIGSLVKEVGGMISQVLSPVIDWLRQAVDWFKALDPSIKQTVMITAALVAGFLALGPVLTAVGAVAGAIFSPMAIVIAGIGLAVSAWVNYMGGVGPAMDYISEKAKEVWEFVRPIFLAIGGVIGELWDTAKEIFTLIWDFVKDTWSSIFGDTQTDWSGIKDYIIEAILYVQFYLRNFGTFAELQWTEIKAAFMVAVDFIKDSGISLLAYLGGIASAIGEVFRQAWRVISGQEEIGNVTRNISQAFTSTFDQISTTLGAGQSAITRSLLADAHSQREALNQSWEQFREGRLRQLNATTTPVAAAGERAGAAYGGGLVHAAQREMQKLDAVLVGSAEDVSRLAAYRDMIQGAAATGVASVAGSSSSAEPMMASGASGAIAPVTSAPSASSGPDQVVTLLTAIRNILTRIESGPSLTMQEARLT